jgi:hypothetical protein
MDSAYEPDVIRPAPARLADVVDREVLEEAGQGVEPQAPACIDVGEPEPTPTGERAAAGGFGDERIQTGDSVRVRTSAVAERFLAAQV